MIGALQEDELKHKDKQPQTEQEEPKRKVKIVYYDDGSTVADMSGTHKGETRPPRRKSTAKEKLRTFFTVARKMVIPMLCTLAALTIFYIIILAIAGRL